MLCNEICVHVASRKLLVVSQPYQKLYIGGKSINIVLAETGVKLPQSRCAVTSPHYQLCNHWIIVN